MEEKEIIANLVRIAEQECVFGIEVTINCDSDDMPEQRYAIQMTPAAVEEPAPLPSMATDSPQQPDTNDVIDAIIDPKPVLHAVTSPIVGSFQRGLEPDGDALVEEGQTVRAGQTVCCVESLKVFREIAAGADGIVRTILVENEGPVDYGKSLFEIEVTETVED